MATSSVQPTPSGQTGPASLDNWKPQNEGPDDRKITATMQLLKTRAGFIVSQYQDKLWKEGRLFNMKLVQASPGLRDLAKRVFGLQEQDTLDDMTDQFELQSLKAVDFWKSVFGMATLQYSLDLDARHGNVDVYQDFIQSRHGIVEWAKFQQATLKILADRPNSEALVNAEKFTDDLFPSLVGTRRTRSNESAIQENDHDAWVDLRANVHSLFERAMAFRLRLQLNILDRHEFFWPPPNIDFDDKRMDAERNTDQKSEHGRILITLFPGIIVYPVESFKNPDGLLLNSGSKSGEVLAKAWVLLRS